MSASVAPYDAEKKPIYAYSTAPPPAAYPNPGSADGKPIYATYSTQPQAVPYYPEPTMAGEKPIYAQSAAPPPPAQGQNHFVQVQAMKPVDPPPPAFRDVGFAIFFALNVIAVVVILGGWGVPTLSTKLDVADDQAPTILAVVGIAIGIAVVGIGISYGAVMLMFQFAETMIRFVFYFNLALLFVGAVSGFFSTGLIVVTMLCGLCIVFQLCYMWHIWARIPFAGANMRVAGASIAKHKSLYVVATIVSVIQIAWVVAWFIAWLGIAGVIAPQMYGDVCFTNADCASRLCQYVSESERRCASSSARKTSGIATFFMLLALHWGLQVLKNISHTTVAGTVGAFWFGGDNDQVVGNSLKRACTKSFGSICMGSLLVAILQTMRSMARGSSRNRGLAQVLVACLLDCLESITQYINRFAFVYVGLYGYSFMQAGRSVMTLFNSRGFTAIINDDLIGDLLSFAAFMIGLLCAGIGVGISYLALGLNESMIFAGIACFIIGVGVALTLFSVVESAVVTVFVCFAEDPAALSQTHPELFSMLIATWRTFHGDVLLAAHY